MELDKAAKPIGMCIDCGSRLFRRTSEWQTPLVQHVYISCSNLHCGATFFGTTHISHRISPSGMPNPAVDIPFTHTAIKKMKDLAKKRAEIKADLTAMATNK